MNSNRLLSKTYSQILDEVVRLYPDQLFIRYTKGRIYERTYSEFRSEVNDFARGLASIGVRKGTKVALWAYNVPEWYVSFMAVVKLGAVIIPINTSYKKDEVEYILRHSEVSTLILMEGGFESDHFEILNELCPELSISINLISLSCVSLPMLRNVITINEKCSGCIEFLDVIKRKDIITEAELDSMAQKVTAKDLCNILYTSGTTSFPKGVMLSHYSLINGSIYLGDALGLTTSDRMLIHVPMFHCLGVGSFTAAITHGTTVVSVPFFTAKDSLNCIEREHITCANGTPSMFIAMMNHPSYHKTDFSHMRTGVMAGAFCPPDLMKKAASKTEMNMYGIVASYGRTESSGCTISFWNDSLDNRCGTVGKAYLFTECKIINPLTGEEIKDGECGELCSKGYNTMIGYYKMPEETSRVIDENGWLHSGDLACRDDAGYYKIIGRISDMIIRGGENVCPSEIENLLIILPYVKDAQVVSVPDKLYGEEIASCIILKDGCQVSRTEIKHYLSDHLSLHKIPRYIEFFDSFPSNASGKVLKQKLKEDLLARLAGFEISS